jgi:hypothetical protein
MQGAEVRQGFPHLRQGYRVLSARSPRYNAISHTIGTYGNWVWPGDTVAVFDSLYGRYGYQRLSYPQYERNPGAEKIVLYGKLRPDGSLAVTSAARQEAGGGYTSKIGPGPLIWHPYADSLLGPAYGQPIAVYARSRPR